MDLCSNCEQQRGCLVGFGMVPSRFGDKAKFVDNSTPLSLSTRDIIDWLTVTVLNEANKFVIYKSFRLI